MSKADQVRAWLRTSGLTSFEIAETVGCHDGYVRAVKQRMLHPERESERFRNDYRSNKSGRRDKQHARNRRRWERISTDPAALRREYDKRAARRARIRAESAHA